MMTEKESRQTEILCMCSGKGGVGKTLFSSCLGYALTRAGLRVLMIDGDLATDGLSLFLLGPKGLEYVNSFEPQNTFAGVISRYNSTGKLEFEVRQVYRNGPEDHGVVYDCLISGRYLYGQDTSMSSIPTVDRGTFRSAVRELFDALRRSGEYDYVIVDTRGGFSFESTDLCGLADSFLVVIEADPTSFYQTRNLVQHIDEAAGESGSSSVLRGFLVNKAVDGLSEGGDLDLSRVESSFRNALTREFPIVKYSDTYPIPADLQVLQSYKAQMVPFLGSPASLFTYATLTAYSNIFQIVTSRWTKDQVAGWQELINSVAAAIKQKNEEAERARENREAEEAAIKLLRETSARNEQRIREEEALIEQQRKEVDLAHSQLAAELARASAVESLIRSVSTERPKESVLAKSGFTPIVLIAFLLALVSLAVLSFLVWQSNARAKVAQEEAQRAEQLLQSGAAAADSLNEAQKAEQAVDPTQQSKATASNEATTSDAQSKPVPPRNPPVKPSSKSPASTQSPSELPAPELLSPPSGAVFNIYPRTTTLEWEPVRGAVSYEVERVFVQQGQNCPAGSPPVKQSTTDKTAQTTFTFNFIGAQPGCWRVSAVDGQGRVGVASPWWEFVYKR